MRFDNAGAIVDELARAATSEVHLFKAIEAIPAPIYVTDAEGVVTAFNRACVGFAGRTPSVGKDRWCVTWKLYTSAGDFLPHDACPMAVAIKARSPVRGIHAVAERPDGTRVTFMPFPTPLFSKTGALIGAINLLIGTRQAAELPNRDSQAAR